MVIIIREFDADGVEVSAERVEIVQPPVITEITE